MYPSSIYAGPVGRTTSGAEIFVKTILGAPSYYNSSILIITRAPILLQSISLKYILYVDMDP